MTDNRIRLVEETLEQREQFLRLIYEGVDQAIFVVGVAVKSQEERAIGGSPYHYKFLGWNGVSSRFTGYASEEVAGKTPFEVFSPEEAAEIAANYDRCLMAGDSIRYEECRHFQGGSIYTLTTLTPLRDETGAFYRIIGTAIDISDRKTTEIALQESQARFKRLADHLPGVTYQYQKSADNPTGVFTYISRNALNLLELTPEMIIQDPEKMWALIHPQDIDEFLYSTQLAAAQQTPWHHEYRVITPSGKVKWLQGEASLEIQPDQSLVWDGIFLDITPRKEAEEALKRSEAILREFAEWESMQHHISMLIRNSLNSDTVIETTVQELQRCLKADRCCFLWFRGEPQRRKRRQQRPSHQEVLKSDATNLASYWEVVQESKNEEDPSFLGQHWDEEGNYFTEQLLGGTTLQLDWGLDCDPQAKSYFSRLGYDAVLLLAVPTHSKKYGALVLLREAPTPWSERDLELSQEIVNQMAIAINQADLYTQATESARIATAKSEALEAALKQLQQAQSQLIQAEKMSSLGQLVAGIAHEINNPISFIYGNVIHAQEYTQDLLVLIERYRQYCPVPPPQVEDWIETIDLEFLMEDLPRLYQSMQMGADRIREIVKSLRTFSRLDEAEMKEVDLHENLDSTLMILNSRLNGAEGSTVIQVVKNYGFIPPVQCYIGQLNQVFMNLLSNAIDALNERDKNRHFPELVKHPSILEIKTELKYRRWVQITIHDNGVGISPEALSRIFDPFYTTKPVGSGTGLGLSTSYKVIVEQHHGKLECKSDLGKGTDFIITIPLKAGIFDGRKI
ncbi:PAS domain S-box protein [Spirulina subsalsa FACHB-351]|uniref:histidine kinase n=1 Tax=Spirulina subsalsa FACHB-351 TaxID=234711 RepID=A0ABT3LB71_9CYAN|nr:ATP-binding protein [Spirulina subsalsa]MCW6038759.1 PAS domain S-box protein [Spirulina subsalsa FACHB-351]